MVVASTEIKNSVSWIKVIWLQTLLKLAANDKRAGTENPNCELLWVSCVVALEILI